VRISSRTDGPIKILLLSRYGRLGASSRLRSYQYIADLQALGIEVQIAPLFRDEYLRRLYAGKGMNWLQVGRDYLQRVFRLFRARRFDLLWVEKEILPNLPAWCEQTLVTRHPLYRRLRRCGLSRYDLSRNPPRDY
jgi:hypothetical protein